MKKKDGLDKILGLGIIGAWAGRAYVTGGASVLAEPLAVAGIGALVVFA